MASGLVLVTGASTGIGEATALHLRSLGFDVLAGTRREEDAERLRAAGLRPVTLDVTDGASIAAAMALARDEGRGRLAGLVNNAGIAVAGPLEHVPIDALRAQLDVNVVGLVAVTQAALPLLRAARGRVVNIGSIGGRVALPLVGPYAASKFAVEAISDALRREVTAQGVRVSLIEPGGVRTPIWDKTTGRAETMREGLSPDAEARYGGLMTEVRAEAERVAAGGIPPRVVAEAVAEALTAERPRPRYLVGRDARGRAIAARVLPDRALDRLIARRLGGH